jgi:hypothetical protein
MQKDAVMHAHMCLLSTFFGSTEIISSIHEQLFSSFFGSTEAVKM